MTEKKYTRKQFIIDMLATNLTDEQRDCAEKWLAALEKKAAAPTVNKKALENEQLANKLRELMVSHADAQINAKWISDHLAGVTSAQKATAVANMAQSLGYIERYTEKGRVYYKLA